MFYAKSKKYSLSPEKITEIREDYLAFQKIAETYLSEKEKQIIKQSLRDIENTQERPQKTLEDHLKETEACALDFFRKYGLYFTPTEQKIIRLACRIHDWGKLNQIFQKKIKNLEYEAMKFPYDVEEIPHGFLSAFSISIKEYKEATGDEAKAYFYPFITAVFYHHPRRRVYLIETIKAFFKNYYVSNLNEFRGKENQIQQYGTKILYETEKKNSFKKDDPQDWDDWLRFVVIKGMLNKFDYTASAGRAESEVTPDLEKKQLKQAIAHKVTALRPAQEFMHDNSARSVILVAGTGSGKTEAALLWLNGAKGFYTLPLQVSSNAIYQRIKDKYEYEDVAVLHSDSLIQYVEEDNDSGGYERYLQARNLSFALTVCTVDQIFKFAYKAFGTELLAATLKYAKVIIDEIQAYSPQLIATLIYSLKIISRLGGNYAIITATFPPVLSHFMRKHKVLTSKKSAIWADYASTSLLKRHWLQIIHGDFNYEEIAKQGAKKKVLVICNTVGRAQEIYKKLKKCIDENDSTKNSKVYLLHSRYIKKHRNLLERKIMEFSADKDVVGIWVATQIVEVSLDIDFDLLHSELCPCDSLLQRMGRCNRQERYEPKEANVFVYTGGEVKTVIYDQDIVRRSLDILSNYDNQLFTEKMKIEYVNKVYDPEKIKNTEYYKKIEEWLDHFEGVAPGDYNLQEVSEKFRMITTVSLIPDVIYDEHVAFIEEGLRFIHTPNIGSEARAIANAKLQELTVSVNIFDGHDKKWLDGAIPIPGSDHSKNKIRATSGIYRCKYGYEFDETTLSGEGLTKAKNGESESIDDYIL